MSLGQHPIMDVRILFPGPAVWVGCQDAGVALQQGLPPSPEQFLSPGRDRLGSVLGRGREAPLDPSVKAEGRKGHVSKTCSQEQQPGLADY